jgi:acyl-CoA thioesterase-1
VGNPIHSRGGALYPAPLLCAVQYPTLQCAVSTFLWSWPRCALRPIAALATALVCAIAAAAATAPTILIVGDSISAGYGLPPNSGWVTLLQQRLARAHYPQRVVNASISGDTSASGRARLDTLLARERPAITVIELGGNDGLRGGSLDAMRTNLDAMVVAAQKAGSRVLLVGMQLPPNYGPAYVRQFDATYADVAKTRHVALVPFLFEGFGDDNALFQPDGIHPVVAAQPRLLDNIWRELQPLLGPPAKAP